MISILFPLQAIQAAFVPETQCHFTEDRCWQAYQTAQRRFEQADQKLEISRANLLQAKIDYLNVADSFMASSHKDFTQAKAAVEAANKLLSAAKFSKQRSDTRNLKQFETLKHRRCYPDRQKGALFTYHRPTRSR
jgi:hypothetical protein